MIFDNIPQLIAIALYNAIKLEQAETKLNASLSFYNLESDRQLNLISDEDDREEVRLERFEVMRRQDTGRIIKLLIECVEERGYTGVARPYVEYMTMIVEEYANYKIQNIIDTNSLTTLEKEQIGAVFGDVYYCDTYCNTDSLTIMICNEDRSKVIERLIARIAMVGEDEQSIINSMPIKTTN